MLLTYFSFDDDDDDDDEIKIKTATPIMFLDTEALEMTVDSGVRSWRDRWAKK